MHAGSLKSEEGGGKKSPNSVVWMERQSKAFKLKSRKCFVVELQHVLPDGPVPCSDL